MSFYEQIIEFLTSNNIWYEETSHEPVFTSQQASEVRGGGVLEMGAKALIFGKEEVAMFVLRGVDKVDSSKAKRLISVKDLSLAKPEKVKEVTGVEIGAVAPFGFLVGIKTFVDKSLLKGEYIYFNPGKHDKTIKIKSSDYGAITSINLDKFAKE